MPREGPGRRCPSISAPPFLEGSLLRLTEPKPRCRISSDEHMLEEGPFGLVRGMGVGFLVLECVAAQ